MNHKLMVVTWIDAAHSGGTYNPQEFPADFSCINIKTVGWGYELEDRVVIAAEQYFRDSGVVDSYRHLFAIPRECIKNIEVLSGE